MQQINNMSVTYGLDEQQQHRVDSSSENDSEDEWKNQDFFESSVYWNHQQKKKHKPNHVKSENEKQEQQKARHGMYVSYNY